MYLRLDRCCAGLAILAYEPLSTKFRFESASARASLVTHRKSLHKNGCVTFKSAGLEEVGFPVLVQSGAPFAVMTIEASAGHKSLSKQDISTTRAILGSLQRDVADCREAQLDIFGHSDPDDITLPDINVSAE
jgi:hypothetical protein